MIKIALRQKCAEAGYTFGLGIRNDIAVFQLLNETRETINAVRINAGFGGAGEHLCTGVSRFAVNAA